MTPAQAIADLDDALSEAGEPCVLRRPGFAGMTPDPVDVAVMARVRTYRPAQIVGAILQGDSVAVLSPTEIIAAGWPGADPGDGTDARVPREGDQIVVAGRVRSIVSADPVYMAGALVRINLQVRG